MISSYTHNFPSCTSCSGLSVLYRTHPQKHTLILSKIQLLSNPRSNILLIYLYRFKTQVIATCNTACSFLWTFCLLGIFWAELCYSEGFALSLSFELLLKHIRASAIFQFLLEIGGSM